MPTDLLLPLVAVFVATALVAGAVVWMLLDSTATARRRLEVVTRPRTTGVLIESTPLAEEVDPFWDPIVKALPTSRGSVKRLRRDLGLAGYPGAREAALFSMAELVTPLVFGVLPVVLSTDPRRWFMALLAAGLGYMLPGILIQRRVNARKREVENGLADVLDLLVLCLEAGSSLDQSIVKASEELSVAYPTLAEQLRLLIADMRAGRSRNDAFRNLATRTQVEDVRSLVGMLIQADRFGTSIAQGLRTHADSSRAKRRQRAEERAEKVSVKLVFPLVFCLFPALYVVMLGPAFIQFTQMFASGAK